MQSIVRAGKLARVPLFVMAAVLASGSAAEAQKFAVRCHGTDFSDDTTTGTVVATKLALDWQTYVIDTDARRVSRAVEARRTLDDLCNMTRPTCDITVSRDSVEVHGTAQKEGFASSVSFEFNRTNGAALHEVNMDYDDGRYFHIRWQMNCEQSPMPAFGE